MCVINDKYNSDSKAGLLLLEAEKYCENHQFLEAIRLLENIQENDMPEKFFLLGYVYETGGDGVPQDTEKAKFFYGRYAEELSILFGKGNLEAGFVMAGKYQYGQIVPRSEKKAMDIYERCAEHGHAQAAFHLSTIWQYGWCGVIANEAQQMYWLDRAVFLEWPEALYHKGLILLKSAITKEQKKHGLELINKAAKAGFWPALEHLSTVK
ncbi:sel1 repeat family protein [Chitiniphilus purpureus]|uniref:Sel1 repeat family protein n=1 Tax=Chitiniphilus purpureus TaxID=2981137 RepID=A0ABY6DV48_9NEIS|nr:tetratricopeptide repeat protein [Chitiniphilus sp. CD1]UXY16941.1 sel1 repeat family protein [Chitiniphilus sp. CD1]